MKEGGVLALPTDSFYGLAVSPFHVEGVKRLMHIKGDRQQKPFPLLIGEISQLQELVVNIPPLARTLMEKYWPGLLTLVVPVHPQVPTLTTGGTGKVGVRQPAHTDLCQLLTRIGPVTGTSANRTGGLPCLTVEDVQEQLREDIDLILDGGRTPGGHPSTVLEVTDHIRVIRQGALPVDSLQKDLGPTVSIIP